MQTITRRLTKVSLQTGLIVPVKGTPMDFTKPARIGAGI
jgi:hypothetical protein